MLKLGYAEADITPCDAVETVGFGREDNKSRGILKPLLAQVTVWEADDRYCLITVDSIGFKKELTDHLRNMVCKALNISTQEVMVCFSHCHSAPNADVEKVKPGTHLIVHVRNGKIEAEVLETEKIRREIP